MAKKGSSLEMLKQKLEKVYDMLIDGVKKYSDSEGWKQYLSFISNFHRYSATNNFLIFIQKPEASLVAGFHTWKKQGRHVKKGEHSIGIFAPMFKKLPQRTWDTALRKWVETKAEDYDPKTGTFVTVPVMSKRLVGFKAVSVFDISQTEGKEVPELRLEVKDKSLADQLEILTAVASQYVPVSFGDTRPSHGYYSVAEDRIVIDSSPNTPPWHQAKTLIHELAHERTYDKTGTKGAVQKIEGGLVIDMGRMMQLEEQYSRGELEVIAESSAFVVTSYFGYDTSEYSFGYVTRYRGDEETLLKLADIIQDISAEIISKVEDMIAE